MITRETVMSLLKTLGDDVTIHVFRDGTIDVTINDFEGFDDDWSEIERDYDIEKVDAVYDSLETMAVSTEDGLYITFHFDDFKVIWGYASFDI